MVTTHRLCWVALTCSGRITVSSFSSSFLPSRCRRGSRIVCWLSSRNTTEQTQLVQQLEEAYTQSEGDGVRELAVRLGSQLPQQKLSAQRVWDAVWSASQCRSGVAATMLNAWMASYYSFPVQQNKDDDSVSNQALELFRVWESHSEVVQPDLVTYALAYAATARHGSDNAQMVLEKGLRWSKKKAGSKRRKALAAARRKTVNTATNRLEDLRALLGNDLDVLQETSDFVVLKKPSGVACNHRMLTTAGKTKKKSRKNKNSAIATDTSLVDALLSCNVPLSTLNPESQGLVHRLDRGTSGCIFVAKTDECHALALSEFYTRRAFKSYLALVSPCPSSDAEGVLDIAVDGRPARSSWTLVEKLGATSTTTNNDSGDDDDAVSAALVQVSTETGRKHQVRVHCAKGLHAPVVNDSVYGPNSATLSGWSKLLPPANSDKERLFLHAQRLSLPLFGVNVEASIPLWWDPTLKALRKSQGNPNETHTVIQVH